MSSASSSSLPTQQGIDAVRSNEWMNESEKAIAQLLIDNHQAHLFAAWAKGNEAVDRKKSFLQQIKQVHDQYPGGIPAYILRAKKLLQLAAIGANPYEGFQVYEPKDGARLASASDFETYERAGISAIHETGFVIVAGGLGERLGYRGIKLAIPSEIVTNTCFLQLYIEHILALQDRARHLTGNNKLLLRFAIMTSDDTDTLTRQLLQDHKNFGMLPEQLTIFKQGKVPSLIDNDGHFCLEESDPYRLDTKPHGHGDVHMLLYQFGIIDEWVTRHQVKWVTFFQDTNGLVFRAIPAAVGVSVTNKLHLNSLTVPRVQGDAVGAICTLVRSDSSATSADSLPSPLTINVEYNQLEGLLGKGVKEPLIPGSTNSVYPGNINVLVFNAIEYNEVLKQKKGHISEFVNPKYNADKKSFKKPTRLECMMQDWPKLLTEGSVKVGFAQFERWSSFSAVKNAISDGAAKQKQGNAPEVAASCEADLFYWGYHMLQQCGCKVAAPVTHTFRGVQVALPPKIVLSPNFAVTQAEVRNKFVGGDKIVISAASTLILDGDITIRSLNLDGTLVIRVAAGGKVVVDGLTVKNKGWSFVPLPDGDDDKVPQSLQIRGYTCHREEQKEFVFDNKANAVLSDHAH